MFKKLKNMFQPEPEINHTILVDRSKLSSESLKIFDEIMKSSTTGSVEEGDGNAVFFGEGSHDEFLEQEKEDKGLKGWYDRIKNL